MMGCERVRDGSTTGFGGVRASMERRWLINAKTTVMRQRKWQEVQLQKDLDEQRKKVEILERRKQERARLAAYIHSGAQPPVKCVTNGKRRHNDSRRVNWKTCLLSDQEHILKLRENAKAVVHNRPSQQDSSNPDLVMQGHYSCKMACCDSGLPKQVLSLSSRSGAQNLCMNKNLGDLVKLLDVRATSVEAVTQNPLLEKDCHSAYKMLQPPKTHSTTCEIAVNTSATWAPNTIPSEANFVENHQSPNMFEISKWRSFTANNILDKCNESQSDRGVLSNSQDARPPVATKGATHCVESMSNANSKFASLEIASSGKGESTTRRSGRDLKEEILQSRLVNEAATTRLIAQVTAIESRLDDCNMNWKSICLQDDEVDATEAKQILGSEVHPADLNLVSNAVHRLAFNNDIGEESSSRVYGIGIKGNVYNDKQELSSLEEQLFAAHVSKTRLFLSSPSAEVSDHITIEGTISDSSLVNGQGEITHRIHGNFGSKDLQSFPQICTDSAGSSSHQDSESDNQGATSSEALVGRQSAQHMSKARVFLPSAEVSNYISFDGTISSSPLVNGQSEITHGVQGNFDSEVLQPFQQLLRNKAEQLFQQVSLPNDQGATSSEENIITDIRLAKGMMYHPKCSSICHEPERAPERSISNLLPDGKNKDSNQDFSPCQDNAKLVKESLHYPLKSVCNGFDTKAMEATCAYSPNESHSGWKIDWNATTNIFPEKNWEDLQSMQSKYYSSMPTSASINLTGEQTSHRSRQLQHLMYEPRQHKLPSFLKCGYDRQNSLDIQGAEDHPSWKAEDLTHRSYSPTCETSGLVHISSDCVESDWHAQDQYMCQDTNWAQNAGYRVPMLSGNKKNRKNVGPSVEYRGDKENQLESQRQSLMEEEQKIFASLERLDWKLAAINLRSMNVGRESAVSQGQYSTKSAPANLGPPHCTIMENFSMTAKKVIPYSALPPRPLTPQGAPMPRIPTARQRRLVGLTNKAGRMHNLKKKSSFSNLGPLDTKSKEVAFF